MLDFNGKKVNIAVVDTGNGSAPTSDGLVNGKGFWLIRPTIKCTLC